MPTYQTLAIVIGRTNFGEADRIIRLLTPAHGKISAVAKGVRKIKSRLAGHLELFGETNLTLATGRNLDVISGAQLMWYPHELATDYQRISLAYAFATLIDRTAAERQPQTGLYSHLNQALHALEKGQGSQLLELWFKLRLLNLTGVRPELSHCVICGTADPAQTYALKLAAGGIVCRNDAGAGDAPMSLPAIKLWRLLSDYPYDTVATISDGPALATATLPLCNAFCEYHLNIKL